MTQPPGPWTGEGPPEPPYGGWAPPPQQPPLSQPPLSQAPQGDWGQQQQPQHLQDDWGQQSPEQLVWYPPTPTSPSPGQWDELDAQPSEHSTGQPRSRRHGKAIAAAVVVAAVVAGGTATYLALADKNTTGAASPDKAIQSVVNDLNKSDLMAALDTLPPGERDALVKPFTEDISQLQRLKVLSGSANPNNVTSVTFRFSNLRYGKPLVVNDHVQLVQITGGSLDFSANAAKVPFTSELLKSAFPHGVPASAKASQHLDLAQQVQRDGHPIRLAAQQVGGRWYPSLFYTVAAAAAADSGVTAVPASDRVPAVGASSPQQAVQSALHALLTGDYRTAIELTSPEEMAALHDYGGLVLANAHPGNAPFTVGNLQVTTTKLAGDAVRVTLQAVTVSMHEGGRSQQVTVTRDGTCFGVVAAGQHLHLCPSDLVSRVLDALDGTGLHITATTAQRQAFADLVSGYASSPGIVTTKVGGSWYVNPVRSSLESTGSVLSALHPDDLIQMITFFQGLGN